MARYGLAKRLLNKLPGSRERLAGAFMALPLPLSAMVYEASRAVVFRDNQHRMPVFEAAFAEVARVGRAGDYLEFGVARGTSLISAYKLAARYPELAGMRFHAFDSFEGLPGTEGDFRAGDMAYAEETFLRFVGKSGVDLNRLTRTKGFFDASLSPERASELQIEPGRTHIIHVDCDIYVSVVPVLNFVAPLLGPGSVIIFDDWFSFGSEERPWEHGEQRAFSEWSERERFEPLAITHGWNAAFKLVR